MEDLLTEPYSAIPQDGSRDRSSPSNTAAGLRTEESDLSVDDSGPSTPTHSLHPLDDSDGVRIIQPYAIEEPEDDDPDTPRTDQLRLPDHLERWQRDLSDYMNDLNYQADGQHAASSKPRKRGQKRKMASSARQHGCSSGNSRLAEAQPVHEQCAKKRRSSSPVTSSFLAFREANPDPSSCSEAQSTDNSGIDTTDNSPMADAMDID